MGKLNSAQAAWRKENKCTTELEINSPQFYRPVLSPVISRALTLVSQHHLFYSAHSHPCVTLLL